MTEKNLVSFVLSKTFRLRLFATGSIGLIFLSIITAALFAFGARLFLTAEDYESLLTSSQFLVAINFLSYFFLILIFFWWLSRTDILLRLWKALTQVNQFKKAFMYFFILYLTLLVAGFIYETLGISLEDNANQSTVTELTLSFPILSVITFVLLGPVAEEITYRMGLFAYLHRYQRWLAYILTALVFGFIHFDYGSTNYLNELLNMPLYMIAGVIFSYVYEREGFEVATITHIVNNGFSILLIWMIAWASNSR